MDNLERYQKVFMNIFNVSEKALNESFTFKDIESWDSISHMSLVSELEDVFDILLETEEILHFGSYENGKKILRSKGVNI